MVPRPEDTDSRGSHNLGKLVVHGARDALARALGRTYDRGTAPVLGQAD